MGTILLARHGQAAWGTRDYDRLTKRGTAQASLLGASLRAQHLIPDLLVSGGMNRHVRTATVAAKAMGATGDPVTIAGFAEFDHMDVIYAHRPAYRSGAVMRADLARTLRPRAAFWAMFDIATARWRTGAHDEDYAETFADFVGRVGAALAEVTDRLGDGDDIALVVTSAGVMAAVAMLLLDPDSDLLWPSWFAVTANTGFHTIAATPSGLVLHAANTHSHLREAGLVTIR